MLEVCVDNIESFEAAVKGGAHRIELCSALSEGGLTPTVGLLKTARKRFPNIDIFAMVRPNPRISYTLTAAEMELIINDMDVLRENGANGFVFGCLTADRSIDEEKCRIIIQNAYGIPVTFHRAFDMTVPNVKNENIRKIAKCGFKRLLTSGFAESADIGIPELIEIQKLISSEQLNLVILPGCGINEKNAENILQATGCKEFHASAKSKIIEDIPYEDSDTSFIVNCIKSNSISLTVEDNVKCLADIGKKFLNE